MGRRGDEVAFQKIMPDEFFPRVARDILRGSIAFDHIPFSIQHAVPVRCKIEEDFQAFATFPQGRFDALPLRDFVQQGFVGGRQGLGSPGHLILQAGVEVLDFFLLAFEHIAQEKVPAGGKFQEIGNEHAQQVGRKNEKAVVEEEVGGNRRHREGDHPIGRQQEQARHRGVDEAFPDQGVAEHHGDDDADVIAITGRRGGNGDHPDEAPARQQDIAQRNHLPPAFVGRRIGKREAQHKNGADHQIANRPEAGFHLWKETRVQHARQAVEKNGQPVTQAQMG